MIAVTKGTTGWRRAEELASNEVEFIGEFLYEADGVTPAMVWDDVLQNVRSRNSAEQAARQAEIDAAAADRAAYESDRADLKAQFSTAAARLAQIRDAASPTNAQVIAAVRDLAADQLKILKYLRKL